MSLTPNIHQRGNENTPKVTKVNTSINKPLTTDTDIFARRHETEYRHHETERCSRVSKDKMPIILQNLEENLDELQITESIESPISQGDN